MRLKAIMIAGALALAASGTGIVVPTGEANAQRYVARCVASPMCRITCSSNRHAVACFAQVQPNGRCFRRCVRAR